MFWNKDIGKNRKYKIYNTKAQSNLEFRAETGRLTEESRTNQEVGQLNGSGGITDERREYVADVVWIF